MGIRKLKFNSIFVVRVGNIFTGIRNCLRNIRNMLREVFTLPAKYITFGIKNKPISLKMVRRNMT